MRCFMCEGSLQDKFTTFMVEIDKCIIIVKNVPSQVCEQCGETSYSNTVARQLEDTASSLRNSLTEIAVVSYTEEAA